MMRNFWHLTPYFVLLAACSGEGNTGRSGPSAAVVEAVPWTNGVVPLQDEQGTPKLPASPMYPSFPDEPADPGSRPADCSGLADIELAAWVEDFEPNAGSAWGVAEAWSSYDDGTAGAFRTPGDAAWYTSLVSPTKQYTEIWGLAAENISQTIGAGPSCNGTPNDWAFHFKGGRFNWYGAGMSHPLATGSAAGNLCPPNPSADSPRADFCPPVSDAADSFWDLSAYDGVAFWARIGPKSQPGVLVALQNQYTSDDLARGHQTHCKRIKTCTPTCDSGAPCVPDAVGVNRCMSAGADPSRVVEPALVEELYPRCGASTCVSPSYYADPDFDGTECKPYEFSGMESNNYCYGDEPPPAPFERCGDGFVAPVLLSTDWQLYKIPFSEFRQVGWGKPAPAMDLETTYSIAFQFTVGFADVYVDSVSFYRNKR